MESSLKSAGLRLTPQRLAILRFLEGNGSHPSAEQIFFAVRKRFPSMSFATVYNTLESLKRTGAIRELKIDPTRRRYDPDTTDHHHLICRRCGVIIDIHACYRIEVPAEIAAAFDVEANHVEFFGFCRRCSERASGSKSGIAGGGRRH